MRKNPYFCNMLFTYHYDSPIGGLTLESNGLGLTGLRFEMENLSMGAQPTSNRVFNIITVDEQELPAIAQTIRWLDRYFDGKNTGATPPLRMESTPFRKVVWETLLSIPYGETASYGQVAGIVARKIGVSRMSAQAVGSAVGHNPIAIIIPCHRVIASDGSIGGFSGGLERKAWLLQHEGCVLDRRWE